jgi:hypothetical protein
LKISIGRIERFADQIRERDGACRFFCGALWRSIARPRFLPPDDADYVTVRD